MNLLKKLFGIKDEPPTPPVLEFHAADKKIQSISVDGSSIFTLSDGVIKRLNGKTGEFLTFEESDNNFLSIAGEYVFSGYYEKSIGIGRKHENIRMWDKKGHLIRTLDAPSLSLGRTFRDIYEVGFVALDTNYIYGLYKLDFRKEQAGSHTGHIVIMVWNKEYNLVNFLQDTFCPDSYFAMDERYIYALSQLDAMAVKGLYIYDKSNPLNITRIKRINNVNTHEIKIDDKNIYLYSRRHLQALNKYYLNVVWERKNSFLDEISKIHVDDKYLYCLHYGLRHNQLDIHDKYSGAIINTLYAEETISCVSTDSGNIYAGLSNGVVKIWSKNNVLPT